jgi:RNA-directed DNA polymerase
MIDQVLDPANLNLAWEQVASKKGKPGPDGLSIERWARNWEENLQRLSSQVKTNTYIPGRPKRIQVMKKDGNFRELTLLNISDKVLQRAVLNVIEPEFDKRFLPCNHGYRPKRSVATAIQQVLNFRDAGKTWVLDADIRSCFDSIDHTILIGRVRKVIKDWHINNLMENWLRVYRKQRQIPLGIPAGAVISPLWCNIYLHLLDARVTVKRFAMVRYADDFMIFSDSEADILVARSLVQSALDDLRLSFAPEKTREGNFHDGFKFLGVEFKDDSYSYTWQQKTIRVQGQQLRTLYKYRPDYY